MDQFSHDLTLALEETSLLDKAKRWGQRRRTRSTGNLPCAPQPTEDSSSPNDMIHASQVSTNVDGLDTNEIVLHSDSDEKDDVRFPSKSLNTTIRLGTLESDSLNETFSPARFFKPNTRRKRKLKRMSVEFEINNTNNEILESPLLVGSATGSIRKRVLKTDTSGRSNLFFCGKRKRSNRDRYNEHDQNKSHSSSMPRYSFLDESRMRPRSFSSTSKPQSDRLLPLNKGLLSKIERMSQQKKTDSTHTEQRTIEIQTQTVSNVESEIIDSKIHKNHVTQQESTFSIHRKKNRSLFVRSQIQQLQFAVEHSMDCGELNDFSSSSSLSSSDSDDADTANGTDREGDDELTDWPGNEGPIDSKFDPKRKLTKKSNLQQIKSEDSSTILEDDTLMSGSGEWSNFDIKEPLESRYQPSEPIAILNKNFALSCGTNDLKDHNINIPFKQIESEMSGETSNPFLASPPSQTIEVREIRAGCRRIKGERPGFSIKTSVNERLARFLQDPRQLQIRLPDIEIYEHDSLLNLATLYSLQMSLENGCAVLNKTSNTTQTINIDQQSMQNHRFLSDFKRRCYDSKETFAPRK